MKTCPACKFHSPSDTECLSCGIIFAKYVEPIPPPIPTWTPPKEIPRLELKPDTEDVRVLFLAFPGAILAAWLCKHFFLTNLLFTGVGIWIHEFGHATIAWLSGRAALPLPFGWTPSDHARSMWVVICVTFLLGVAVWKSVRQELWALCGALGLLFLLQLRFTFGLSESQYGFLLAYGGIGGQFYLGALLMAAFYVRIRGKKQWDYARYAVLLLGAYSFLHTYLQWVSISHNQSPIPWGSIFQGESDAGGDMNQLYNEGGWTKKEIITLYLRTGAVTAFGTAAVYFGRLAFYFKWWRKRSG